MLVCAHTYYRLLPWAAARPWAVRLDRLVCSVVSVVFCTEQAFVLLRNEDRKEVRCWCCSVVRRGSGASADADADAV